MSRKPERRRSQLGSLSPVAPTSGRAEVEQPAPEQPAAEKPATTPAAPPKVAAAAKTGTRKKIGYYGTQDDDARIRAAFIAARNAGKRWRTLSDFQLDAVLAQVAEVEAELNGGRPFEGAPAHTLSPGRPME